MNEKQKDITAAGLATRFAAAVCLAGFVCGLHAEAVDPPVEQIREANGKVRPEGVFFPADSDILNVKAFGAVGDGRHDDTEAFQAAYNKTGLIYVPDGVYVISAPIKAPPREGSAPCRRILQGQSRDKTVIRVADRSAAFADADNPQAVITTSWGVAQAFRNSVFNMTIDVGEGNPGAIGLAFFASNQGAVKDVLIKAPSGSGHTGLSLTGDNGPLLVWNVHVEGFDTGVQASANALATFENLSVRGQRKVGVDSGLKTYIHKFKSENAVPAVKSKHHMFILVDGQISGGSPDAAAMILGSNSLVKDAAVSGYGCAISKPDGKCLVKAGFVDFYASQNPLLLNGADKGSVKLKAEDSPEIPWGDVKNWVNITKFKPEPKSVIVRGVGRRVQENWAPAIQAAADSGASTLYFPAGKRHASGVVKVPGTVKRIIGCESELRPIEGEEGVVFEIVDDGTFDPLIIERFDAIYAKMKIVNKSSRPLAVRHIVCDHIVKEKGAGDLFLDDVCCGSLDINGGNVWARQLNQEGSFNPEKEPVPRPNTWNRGGKFWLFGLKTEQNRTKVITTDGGISEIYAFILANRAENPLPMFACDNASAAVSVYETTLRSGPFASVMECKDALGGKFVAPGSTHKGGVCRPWVVFTPDKKPAAGDR